ncbi:MAG: DUF5698 domain-containing protein [Brevefilum sp.]|nr:DUF5698 domain-containing protein [Brevefilum sp.]MDW7754946.1 DUF5698 domain-containing protein [Brevefilum sp.]
MDIFLSPAAWLIALGIFAARTINIALDTLRFMFSLRGKRAMSWVLGFVESVLFVVIIGQVLNNLSNPLNIIGYAAGFATGTVLGMAIEKRLAIGYTHFSIISRSHSTEIADALRAEGYGVTEIPARGRESNFILVDCHVRRKQADDVEALALKIDPDAFITAEEVTPRRSGIWRP